jgi:hypothetical protein
MQARILSRAVALVSFALLASVALAQQGPLSGTWTGDWGPSAADRNQVTVELKWDGKALSGLVNPGANAVELKKCSFDAKSGMVHMEADAKSRRGADVHYMIDGKLDGNVLSGTWNHDARKGDFKITKK